MSYLIYPSLISATLLTATLLVKEFGIAMALPITVSTAFCMVLFFEVFFPEKKQWRPVKREVVLDIFHTAFSNTLPALLFKTLFFSICLKFNSQIVSAISFNLWPSEAPMIVQGFLGLFCAEFGFYSLHRFLHISKFWPLHSLHHSVERMYILAGSRTHPVQVFFTYGGQMFILWTLGAPDIVLFYHAVFTSINGLLQHANIKMKFGFLNYIFATPQLHRWHHSTVIAESNNNYGTNLILWDLLLGTHFLPKEKQYPDALGLMPEDVIPLTFKDQMASAFKRYK